jgi:hypothetical protein
VPDCSYFTISLIVDVPDSSYFTISLIIDVPDSSYFKELSGTSTIKEIVK